MPRPGVTHIVFGDLFLEDGRAYREQKLAGSGITPLFPLWRQSTDRLAHDIIDAGVETYLVCVDLKQISKTFAGRRFDHAMLAELPATADPAARMANLFVRGCRTDVIWENSRRTWRDSRARRLRLCGLDTASLDTPVSA
jgi:hypothetical protein